MKKNYFYTNLQEQFSLLERAASSRDTGEIARLQKACYERQMSLCRHLMRDFITPVNREDLYGISAAVLAVFPALFDAVGIPGGEKDAVQNSVVLLTADPFRFDETALRRREDLRSLWGDRSFCSSPARLCFAALDKVAEALLLTAIRNA